MPVNPINSLSGVNKSNPVSFKANDAIKNEQKSEVNVDEKPKHSKLPYVAGGVVLAGLGVFLGNKYLKTIKKEPHIQKEILALENKVKDKVDEVVNIVVTEVKEAVKKEEKPVQEVVIKTIEPKAARTAKKAKEIQKLKESAVDAHIVTAHAPVEKSGNGAVNVESLKQAALMKQEALKPVIEFNQLYEGEVVRIVGENNFGGFINLQNIEKAAKEFSVDKNRPDNIKQAANLLEYGYRRAYLQSHPNKSAEGLENIINRVSKESDDLFALYAKMPKEEVLNRVTVWADSMRLQDKGYKFKAMEPEDFLKEMTRILADKKII